MKYSSNKNKKIFKIITGIVITALIVGAALIFLHIENVRSAQKKSGTVANVTSKTAEPQTPSNQPSNGTSPDQNSDTKNGSTAPTTPSTTPPATPYGNLVSNHRPGQNGTGTSEQSVCNTTPGATCDITFTNANGITKDLGKKTTDSSGAALWSWDINGSNLGPGVWTVKAVAEQNSQTSATTDTIKLEVQ